MEVKETSKMDEVCEGRGEGFASDEDLTRFLQSLWTGNLKKMQGPDEGRPRWKIKKDLYYWLFNLFARAYRKGSNVILSVKVTPNFASYGQIDV